MVCPYQTFHPTSFALVLDSVFKYLKYILLPYQTTLLPLLQFSTIKKMPKHICHLCVLDLCCRLMEDNRRLPDTLSPSPLPLPREIGDQLAADHKFEKWHRVHSGKKDATRIVFIDLLHFFMLQQTSPHNLLS